VEVETLSPFVIAGATAGLILCASLVLWLGFKLLLLPLRFSWRFGRSLAGQIGPMALMLLLVWTIALEPGPFLYLWDWFLRFGKALLIDTPRQLASATPGILGACQGPNFSYCLGSIGSGAQQLWSAAIAPVATFYVPPHLDKAVVVFAVGTTIAAVIAKLPAAGGGQAARYGAREVAALTASFVLALYLSIIAIIAIPVFGQKVPDIAPYRVSLASQLEKAIPSEEPYPALVQLDNERASLPDIGKLRHTPTTVDSALTPDPSTSIMDTVEAFWMSQLDLWKQEDERLGRAAAALPTEARSFAQTALSFFQVSNEGYIGEIATQRHVTVLANSFNLWIADYRAALDACAATLSDGLGKFRSFYLAFVPISKAATNLTIPTDEFSRAFQLFSVPRCNDLKPVARDYLPPRSGPAETLGPFGTAAAWLLRTESPELALIIGLLGFGFFGALATSFIREFVGTTDKELPSVGFIVPALIRGIGAAILVFLLAMGGTAILTRGDATPNAYAIFFACFVAAVFSDDVWLWARARQQRQFAEEASKESIANGRNGGSNTPGAPSPQSPPAKPPPSQGGA